MSEHRTRALESSGVTHGTCSAGDAGRRKAERRLGAHAFSATSTTPSATFRADGNPASREDSIYAVTVRQRIFDYTTDASTTQVCILCAAPTIIEIHKNLFRETGLDTQLIHNEVRALAMGTLTALRLAQPRQLPNKIPWGMSSPVGNTLRCPLGRADTALAFAPPQPNLAAPAQLAVISAPPLLYFTSFFHLLWRHLARHRRLPF